MALPPQSMTSPSSSTKTCRDCERCANTFEGQSWSRQRRKEHDRVRAAARDTAYAQAQPTSHTEGRRASGADQLRHKSIEVSRPTAGWVSQRHSQPAPSKVQTKPAQARPPACEPGPVLPPPPPPSSPTRPAEQANGTTADSESRRSSRESPLGYEQLPVCI
jgi:hypothetical protein